MFHKHPVLLSLATYILKYVCAVKSMYSLELSRARLSPKKGVLLTNIPTYFRRLQPRATPTF